MAKVVCVTSCITGIAHTYMAAEVGVAKAMKSAVELVEQVLAAAADGTAAKVGEGSPAKAAEAKTPSEPKEKKGGFFGGLFGKK